MADIFISYKKEDAGRVVRIVEGLRKEGFSVWWDHGIAPGSSWDQTIQTELEASKLVIAVWSELSVSAPWVKEEAGYGKARGKLLPVRIDDVEPPLGFGLIQMADLSHWDGDIEDATWDHFIEAARAVIAGEPVKGLEKPLRKKNRWMKMLPIAALVTLVAGAGLYALIKLDSIAGVSVDYDNGATSEYSRNTPAKPSAAEEAMFTKVNETRLKSDYQDFLRSFPNGAYARKVREEILPLCQGEMRPVWQRQQPLGQQQVSVSLLEAPDGSPIIYHNKDEACASAKKEYQSQVDFQCRSLMQAQKGREPELNIAWADCECTENQGQWWCKTLSTYSCTYEFESQKYVEGCG